MSRHESGHTLLEIIVVAGVMGLLSSVLMPAVSGYQTNGLVRATTAQAIADFREAQQIAISQGSTTRIFLNIADRPPEGYTVVQMASGKTLWQVTTPSGWNFWAPCYSATFTPAGSYADWCGSKTSPFEAFCIENHAGSNNISTQFWIVLATGQIYSKQQALGKTCP